MSLLYRISSKFASKKKKRSLAASKGVGAVRSYENLYNNILTECYYQKRRKMKGGKIFFPYRNFLYGRDFRKKAMIIFPFYDHRQREMNLREALINS